MTAGYHRLFAHRTYRAAAPVRWTLLLFGAATFQNSALSWSADHRAHHADTDGVGDPHAITRGAWTPTWAGCCGGAPPPPTSAASATCGRCAASGCSTGGTRSSRSGSDSCCRWRSPATWGDALGGLFVAGFLRAAVMMQATFCINSLAHLVGTPRYDARANRTRQHADGAHHVRRGVPQLPPPVPVRLSQRPHLVALRPEQVAHLELARAHLVDTVRTASPASIARAEVVVFAPSRRPRRHATVRLEHCASEVHFETSTAPSAAPTPATSGSTGTSGSGGRRPTPCSYSSPARPLTWWRCLNAAWGCNWVVPAESDAPWCRSCPLTRGRPDEGRPDAIEAWVAAEAAKRRLVHQLDELSLPVEARSAAAPDGLAFDLVYVPGDAGDWPPRWRGDARPRRGRRPSPRGPAKTVGRTVPDVIGNLRQRSVTTTGGGWSARATTSPASGSCSATKAPTTGRRSNVLHAAGARPGTTTASSRAYAGPPARGLGRDVRPLPARRRRVRHGARTGLVAGTTRWTTWSLSEDNDVPPCCSIWRPVAAGRRCPRRRRRRRTCTRLTRRAVVDKLEFVHALVTGTPIGEQFYVPDGPRPAGDPTDPDRSGPPQPAQRQQASRSLIGSGAVTRSARAARPARRLRGRCSAWPPRGPVLCCVDERLRRRGGGRDRPPPTSWTRMWSPRRSDFY